MQEEIEPQAYLRNLRNVPRGLKARSKIARSVRNNGAKKGRDIAHAAGLSYSAAMRHLRHMKEEHIVEKRKEGWNLTGLGQQSVTEYLSEKKGVKRHASEQL
jgi:predicted transcriptional regulator